MAEPTRPSGESSGIEYYTTFYAEIKALKASFEARPRIHRTPLGGSSHAAE
jgi:hypothetical protein